MPATPKHQAKSASRGVLRIIGGQWRSRKLSFTDAEGLRPTGDRIRETLFNWLSPDIVGARCLDLFAGSGALGLEALSRGAADCDFVELHTSSARQIEQHLKTLNSDRGRVHCQSAQQFIEQCTSPFDILFLDPPFNKGLLELVASHLGPLCKPHALIYVESEKGEVVALPPDWQQLKEKTSGQVCYRLCQRSS